MSTREGIVFGTGRIDDVAAGSPKGRGREALLIAVLALTLNLAGNGQVSLWDRDEPRYAGCTREMIAKGEWIFPTFNGEPRFHKPILIYWLMRAGFSIGGDNPFGARLISGLAGTATCLLVLKLGRRMLGQSAGFLSALMLTTAPIMVIESKLATTDATLALFLVGSQFCLWELSKRPSKRLAALFWVLMGLATLTKGPVGLAMIACSGVVSWWWGGPVAAWGRLCWKWGIPLFLVVIAPWFIAVGIASQGEFFRFALGKQVADRIVSKLEEHGGFPGYYVLTSFLTFYPWSALLPMAIHGAWRRRRDDPEFGFLLGWVVGPWILLECVQTKLVHYYLPAIPACALLTGRLVDSVVSEGLNVRRFALGKLSLNLLGGTGIGFFVIFVALAWRLPSPLRLPCLIAALVIGGGTLRARLQLQKAATYQAMRTLAGSWTLTILTVFAWLLPAAEPYRLSRIVGEKLASLSASRDAAPVLLSFQEPSMIYTMRRQAYLVRTWPGFYSEVERKGVIATAMLHPKETSEFASRSDHLDIEIKEVVSGFDLNKGKRQTLHLALIRRKPGTMLPDLGLAPGAHPEKTLVK